MSRLARQSFLGAKSDVELSSATVGIVGLGGGGSQIVQQLAHVGIGRYVLSDPQNVDDTNTNRLVGATLADVEAKTPKVDIAIRVIRGLEPTALICRVQEKWIHAIEDFRSCDVIIGAVDSLMVRDQLERFARRNLIPYIDVGMCVTSTRSGHLISGQVIRSMPGHPCMHCVGFITPEKLKIEAKLYGDAGENPQVVWPNGVLASNAVGLCVGLLTPWCSSDDFVYLSYDGNHGILKPSQIGEEVRGTMCPHHPPIEVGQPRFKAA